jgi:hypothetical protein
MANDAGNFTRALLGQGLGASWGDEAEAWLRSKIGEETYEQEMENIKQDYARYSQENPVIAAGAELAGGVLPMVASYLATPFTGGAAAPAAVATTARTAGALKTLAQNPYLRSMVLGGATGAVAGAGSSDPGERLEGVVPGAVVGTVLGGATPVAMRAASAGYNWLKDRLSGSAEYLNRRAARKVNQALERTPLTAEEVAARVLANRSAGPRSLTPAEAEARVAADRGMGVPSTLANVSKPTVSLGEVVAAKGEGAADVMETGLERNRTGQRERVMGQTKRGTGTQEDFYAQEQEMVQNLRSNADTLYDDAYSFGTVNDPTINRVLQNPRFKTFFDEAKKIADNEALAAELRGEDPTKYVLDDLFVADSAGNIVIAKQPDVRTLDYIKRGMDAVIDRGYKGEGMSSAEAASLKELKRSMVDALDRATEVDGVSAYRTARQQYAGDAEVLDALRLGRDDFKKLDSEQITSMMQGFSAAEQDAFRTGAVRNIYSMVMDPTANINAAQRLIGSPEMQRKLMPLFSSPAKFDLFKAAMERESQLFQQSNRILAGSPTARRTAGVAAFDEGEGLVGAALSDAMTTGWIGSLTNMAANLVSKASISDQVAERVAKLLVSSDPHEVAAAVRFLEKESAGAATAAATFNRAEAGAVMGLNTAYPPSPIYTGGEPADIEADSRRVPGDVMVGPDIEADIARQRAASSGR